MRARAMRAVARTWIAAACVAVAAAAFAGPVEDADAAFAAGEHDRALALYDRALEADADDTHVLFRSALLLSWSRRFDEAVARYDRLLALEPDHPRATLERAKVLSWARRFGEAETAFEDALVRDPGSLEARLGLARTRSWSGRQMAARADYREALARHPDAADAAVGVAQTYAWSGDAARARAWYARALEIEAGNKEAHLGLAYVDLWAPERAATDVRLRDLESRFPDDAEVADLARAREGAERWWIAGAWDWLDDTEDNTLHVLRVEAGFGPATRWDVTFGVAHHLLDSPVGDGTIDSVYAIAGWNPMPRHRFTFRLGEDFTEDSAGETDARAVGGATWRYTPETWWQLEVAAARDSLRYSPLINDNGIVIDSLRVTASTRPADRWRANGTIDAWDVSDGNARRGLALEGWYRWSFEPVTLDTGYTFQWADWDEHLGNGYFDPENFRAHLLRAEVAGPLPVAGGRWEAGAAVGLQSFDTETGSVSNDTVVGLRGRVVVPLTSSLSLDAYALWTDYAAGSAAGFESRQAGIRLRWQF